MTSMRRAITFQCALAGLLAALAAGAAPAADESARRQQAPPLIFAPNPHGVAATFHTSGRIDQGNPFFRSLGTNGRSCGTCHTAQEGWTITPEGVRERFRASRGTDPIFRLNDGANSPNADVSTLAAREKAYNMLLDKGLIRVGLGIPETAQFELVTVDDPYGFASAQELSLFRRPLPTANLRFINTVMWDGRETFKSTTSTDCVFGTSTCFAPLHFDLTDQSNSATVGHAQAANPLTDAQREAIVGFEMGLFTAQVEDRRAGRLSVQGATGGPVLLAAQDSYFGINDTLVGDYRTHASFTPDVMSLFGAWASYIADARRNEAEGRDRDVAVARRAVARGQALFNGKPIMISGVKGINDDLHITTLPGTCTTCHNTPNAGNHSIPMPLDIGIADASRRTPDLPLYTLRNKQTGEQVQTTDPGRALVTGKWQDIGRFKGPTLRALAARAPYFHNGSAGGLREVVDFYNQRFGIGFSADEIEDLVSFLKAL
jgi:cytochrome c peroxidase